ncbi:endoplasmic reticulum metallopeptidase 1 isoform X2 [Tripterygium wilfordii]|uniref:Vacuolar membrane protease n=1 Tax=Tripterygium wilfordii TaxID=458696 RepID=A0A7J7CI71_TRIWF|nr:endoplasmic reticulum metallopeptidase 1 [Tripterygium wilfordii]KAF5733748.1 endoplasmic reticulum metallopeptidase 1 isoform X2 [Tripterygium wilfordii]
MRQRPGNSPAKPKPSTRDEAVGGPKRTADEGVESTTTSTVSRTVIAKRSGFSWLFMFVAFVYGSWAVYQYQYQNLPVPLTAEQAGKRGFSEVEAMKHVKVLTELGPHPVGSDALDRALQYVLSAAENIRKTAHWEVEVEVDFFHSKSGANRMVGGLFKGKTLVYSDLKHIILRISPKYTPGAEENAILVSSHIDTVSSAEGAGDCSSCVAVMLELARGVSQWAHGFKNAVIFLLNTGEEEGLNGAHSFITQHPWNTTVRVAIDLEAMGVGGKSVIFQAGPHPWAIENFALAAKYPSGQIVAQDIFSSGVIKSATDFQIYKELAGLSGLDFAFMDNGAVYHTKNDKLELLTPGSLQHLGENMLAFLLQIAPSSHLPVDKSMREEETGHNAAVFFDILGTYMIVYNHRYANMLHNSVILQSLLIWTTSLLMGGYPAAISLALSCLSAILMWICSISFSALVAIILPLITSSPVPYVASPWLVVGLFAAPALLGALTGQHLGYFILQTYLSKAYSKRKQLPSAIQAELIKAEAERWLFKAGFLQWFILLILGSYYKFGSSYMALVWLVSPAFAYGMLEATLTPVRLPRPLKLATLLIGLAIPILVSAGTFIQLTGTVIGIVVRFDRNPGGSPQWLGNVIVATFIAVLICLTMVYLLSYVHLSGAKRFVILVTFVLFGLSLAVVLSGVVPPFSEGTARAVNVVHVVDATGRSSGTEDPASYISLFSTTAGHLMEEVDQIAEGFICGTGKVVDFITFSVKYGCWANDSTEQGWSKSDIPTMNVDDDTAEDRRTTRVSFDTKASIRWSLAINTDEIEDFILKGNEDDLIPLGDKSSIDGWHIIQFSGGKNAPTKFELKLFWGEKSHQTAQNAHAQGEDRRPLLKLRTDVDRVTPKTERVLKSLPAWCSLFGKSTSPNTLAFLTSLPVNFSR